MFNKAHIYTYKLYLISFPVWQSFGYFLLTLALEIWPSLKLTPFMIKKWWRNINIFQHNTTYRETLLEPSSETVSMDLDEDVDVKTERNRVLSGSLDNSIIYLRNLRKVFSLLIYLNLFFHPRKRKGFSFETIIMMPFLILRCILKTSIMGKRLQ